MGVLQLFSWVVGFYRSIGQEAVRDQNAIALSYALVGVDDR